MKVVDRRRKESLSMKFKPCLTSTRLDIKLVYYNTLIQIGSFTHLKKGSTSHGSKKKKEKKKKKIRPSWISFISVIKLIFQLKCRIQLKSSFLNIKTWNFPKHRWPTFWLIPEHLNHKCFWNTDDLCSVRSLKSTYWQNASGRQKQVQHIFTVSIKPTNKKIGIFILTTIFSWLHKEISHSLNTPDSCLVKTAKIAVLIWDEHLSHTSHTIWPISATKCLEKCVEKGGKLL